MSKYSSLSYSFFLLLLLFAFSQCAKESQFDRSTDSLEEAPLPEVAARFTLMPPERTGLNVSNTFKEDYTYNIFTYEYIYNGCGVAAGDVNGDGLPDLYLTPVTGPNRLFLNLGDFNFLDITNEAGVAALDGFKTGVVMADVNGDGRLDIYSCRTSKTDDGLKTNYLFINMGYKPIKGKSIPFFEEKAVELGLDDNSDSHHASFFDFDRDGDLDVFILNHRIDFENSAKLRLQEQEDGRIVRITKPETPFESNQLYRNDNGHFKEVTAEAGLVNSAFGLSVTAVDLNDDGWLDLYVANDFVEPDYVYINNKDGTFTDHYFDYFRHSSQNSMGSDIADLNNDGLNDIVVLDMKAEDPFRYKQLANLMTYDRYSLLVQYGYGRQVVRNVLQLNTGNNTYVDIGQYAGIAATDWSWAPVIADFDNDGWKDIYITNGYRRDITDLDYVNFIRDSIERTGGVTPRRYPDIYEVLKQIPEKKLNNYLYINTGNLSFIDAGKQAGMDHPSFSNGAAYADLDQDGDLDLIVNNIDDPVSVYRNDISNRNWLQINVVEDKNNPIKYGTSVTLFSNGSSQYHTLLSTKGFLSTSEPILHFGLGKAESIDSMLVVWPNGDKEIYKGVSINQRLQLVKGSGEPYKSNPTVKPKAIFASNASPFNWRHQENKFVDFKNEKMLPYMLSAEGPCLAVGDLNGDLLDDVFAGNGSSYPAGIFFQKKNGGFEKASVPVIENDASFEDCGAVLDDFDQDGDKDIIVISGGSEYPKNSILYKARLYTNEGNGTFSVSSSFPDVRTNSGAIKTFDFDRDGDMDVIIGGKSTPGRFPEAPKSYLLRNDGGSFTEVSAELFPALDMIGMVSDIEVADLNGDGLEEIIIVGEWMPVSVFSFNGNQYIDKTDEYGFSKTHGWWKSIKVSDIDGDGDMDIVAGNIGLNSRLRASEEEPITLITKDFDNNGFLDPIMCFYYQHKLYPFATRDAIIAQIPALKKKFTRYAHYNSAPINEVFTKSELSGATYHYTYTFETSLFKNENGRFSKQVLPYQVQLNPTNDIIIRDFNQDGKKDILLAGNFLYSETETSEMDAGTGTLLLQRADGKFTFIENRDHGFWAPGEVRELVMLKLANGNEAVLTGNNEGPIELHTILK